MNALVDSGHDGDDVVSRLGFVHDTVVQEFGYDDDVDDDFRFAVEDVCGGELEDEDYTGASDAALLWWRDGDGDLADALVDMVGAVDEGFVVLLTPRSGRPGVVEASLVDEAAEVAGLHTAARFRVGAAWRATRLVAPRGKNRR